MKNWSSTITIVMKTKQKRVYTLNYTGIMEVFYVHIKLHAMKRAMTFDKGLSEMEVPY